VPEQHRLRRGPHELDALGQHRLRHRGQAELAGELGKPLTSMPSVRTRALSIAKR
jgi:hypothetical protein